MMRVIVQFTGIGIGVTTATHYFVGADDTAAAQLAVNRVGAFWTALDTDMANYGSWTTEPEVAVMLSTNGNIQEILSTTPQTGTGNASANALPVATQGLVRWRTGSFVDSREVRGRTFIPGLTSAANAVGGVPLGTWKTAVGTAAATLASATAPDLAVWQREREYRPATEDLPELAHRDGSVHLVTASSVWDKWAVLRTRRD